LGRIGAGFPNQRDFDSTCWLGGGQQEMAKPYSQDLRDRVIDAVKRGEMSRRAAARRYEISESVAIKWLERVERDGSREPVGHGGHRASKLMPHRDFLEVARIEKPDVTLQALCDRLSAERGVKADTSMMSRFFRRIGVTVKKRPLSRASRIAQTSAATANDGEPIRASSTPGGWSSSMKPGPRPT
jgi:transposase